MRLLAAIVLAMIVALVQAQPLGEKKKEEEKETADYALRRAQAFHDMYAGTVEKSRLAAARRQAQFRITEAKENEPPPARPLPIQYPSIDSQARLRAVKAILSTQAKAPGISFHSMMPRPAAVPGTNWRNIGPVNSAGRVSALAVDPKNPSIIYRGTAGGGVWKTVDGGKNWAPLTDSLGNLSVGAVAVAPSDPNIVYVGTGEGAMGIDGIDGIGFISSEDAGSSWNLPASVIAAKFFAISVHPQKSKELLAATSKGVQRSVDGGKTWKTVLASKMYGTELIRYPGAGNTVYATVWDVATVSGSGNGFVYRSDDGGATWSMLAGPGSGLPTDVGRLAIAIAPSKPEIIYIIGAASTGDVKNCRDDPVDQVGIFQSVDGGKSWTLRANPISGSCPTPANPNVGYTSILAGQGWYALTVRVDPTDANTVYAGGLDLWKSIDGAATWRRMSEWDLDETDSRFVHADIHVLRWNRGTLLIGNDGGVTTTRDGAKSFKEMNDGIATRQYYSIAISPVGRDLVVGGAQDNGTNIRIGNTAQYNEVIGGDGFGVAVNPKDPKIIYGTVYSSQVYVSRDGGKSFKKARINYDQSEIKPFITPLTMDPVDPSILYTGTNYLWRTTDGGQTWARVSNTDLGADGNAPYLTKIAVAPKNTKHLLTGSGSGAVFRSTDGGASWTRLMGLPNRYVSHVEFDPADTNVFYVSYTTLGGNRLFRTKDGGATFKAIDQGLPPFPIHVVRADPGDAKTLYVGTDVGLYRSKDSGASWSRFGTGLPAVSVWDLAILADGSILRVATHGRGFFELEIP